MAGIKGPVGHIEPGKPELPEVHILSQTTARLRLYDVVSLAHDIY